MEGVSQHFWRVVVRKLVLAVLAAWISIWIIALPSAVHAEGRGEWQGRPRPQIQLQPPPDFRRGGGLAGMLRDIAGARLPGTHADRRCERPVGNDRGGGRRR